MNKKRVLEKVQEKIAVENFKLERDRNRRNRKILLIAGTAVTVFVAGFITAKKLDRN